MLCWNSQVRFAIATAVTRFVSLCCVLCLVRVCVHRRVCGFCSKRVFTELGVLAQFLRVFRLHLFSMFLCWKSVCACVLHAYAVMLCLFMVHY